MKKIWFDEAWEDYTYWQMQDKIVKMIINNYRKFENAEFDFDDNVTVLAGVNNI